MVDGVNSCLLDLPTGFILFLCNGSQVLLVLLLADQVLIPVLIIQAKHLLKRVCLAEVVVQNRVVGVLITVVEPFLFFFLQLLLLKLQREQLLLCCQVFG